MKKILVYFGYKEDWSNIYNKDELLKYLNDIISDVKVFTTIDALRDYLKNEGKNYKNYILPVRTRNTIELNDAKINNLFKIETLHLKELDNKKLFLTFVKKNNLEKYVPKYYTEPAKGNELVILKPHTGGNSSGIYTKKINEVNKQEFEQHIVQKYIYDKKEYAGYFVSHEGKIVHSFAFERDFGNSEYIKVQNKYIEEKIISPDSNIITKVENFLKPYKYTGVSCFDYKIVNGELFVFEINPRLGGSLINKIDKLSGIIRQLVNIYDKRNVFN